MDSARVLRQLRKFFSMREGRASYETIHRRILASARIDGIHLCLLVVAMLIASIGLNTNSTEVIIGAMLICPLMGSVLALAYAVATADIGLLKSSFFGLLVQVAFCLTTSALYFALSPIANRTSELLTNASPTVWDILIAFVGGFAAGIANSRQQEPSTLIAGVAVATALMPPLCAAGYGIAQHSFSDFSLALYEFLVNVVFIGFGTHLVLTWLRVPVVSDLDGDGVVTEEERALALERSHALRKRIVAGSLLFALPCLVVTAHVVDRTRAENGGELFETQDVYDVELTTLELRAVEPDVATYAVGVEDSYDVENETMVQRVIAEVVSEEELTSEQKWRVEKLIRLHVPQLDEVEFEEG